jgi:DNA sulfur modification protein DndD
MRFVSLEVENIFAYNGLSRIDMSDTSTERNIIIVSGRNGAGKTSLLNAVKLLFLGHTDERLRRIGFGGTSVTAKQFVMGVPGKWYGVFNRASRSNVAHVALEWTDRDRAHRARRTYRLAKGGSDFESELLVTVDGVASSSEDGEAILNQLLPREVVPFFFFDGEQIQSLADAEIGREKAEMERLLGLSFVNHLLDSIGPYVKEKSRAGLPQEVRVRIVEAENAVREARAQAEASNRARVQEEEARVELERERRRLDDERSRLRGGALSDSERRRIEGRIGVLEYQREQLALKLGESLPPEAPFLGNLGLVKEAFQLLDGHSGATDNSAAGRLHRELATRISNGMEALGPPVQLSEEQLAGLPPVVSEALRDLGVEIAAPANPLLRSLSPKKLAELRDRFLVWSERGGILLAGQQDDLRSMRQVVGELQRIRRELDEAELVSDEAKARHAELSTEIERIDADIIASIERIAEHRIAEQRALRAATEKEDRIAALEAEHRQAVQQNAEYRLALNVKQALERYRDLRRGDIRASVERRLNERVGMLLGPSQLIKSVSLDDQFVMSYYDGLDQPVARLSISAGMRQLVAMAMLWALKDESGRPLPVIVDTPLGRIDRTNRGLLMREYFPNAGNPLVLLPTDTEFGPDGFEQIGDRVRRRYRIENHGGDSATIVPEASTPARSVA